MLRLDHRLAGLARQHGLAYTRYADDLTFSGDLDRAVANRIRVVVERIVGEEGFVVNREKTRLMTQGCRQSVTGVVVNQVLGLSRKERRKLRAAVHRFATNEASMTSREKLHLEGKLAYLSMLNAEQAAELVQR